jgi:hypothetical protein
VCSVGEEEVQLLKFVLESTPRLLNLTPEPSAHLQAVDELQAMRPVGEEEEEVQPMIALLLHHKTSRVKALKRTPVETFAHLQEVDYLWPMCPIGKRSFQPLMVVVYVTPQNH